MTLLDVGCGPATITADLAEHVTTVVGIDPSESVIEEAQRDFPSLDVRVDDLFTHQGHYDVVHAHQVVHHVGDPVVALRRMAELGDLVAVRDADYTAFQWEPASPALDQWRELYLAVARRNDGRPDAGRYLLRWANEAGLKDVTYTTSTWTFAAAEDVSWWAGTWIDRALHSSFAEQAREYGLASQSDLESISEGWRAWSEAPHAHITLLHGEVLALVR